MKDNVVEIVLMSPAAMPTQREFAAPITGLLERSGYRTSFPGSDRYIGARLDLDRMEEAWRMESPALLMVIFDPDAEVLDTDLLMDVCEMIYRTDYLGIRTVLIGKTPDLNPAIFLSQSSAVICSDPSPETLLELLGEPDWKVERLMKLPGLRFRANGQIFSTVRAD